MECEEIVSFGEQSTGPILHYELFCFLVSGAQHTYLATPFTCFNVFLATLVEAIN